MPHINIAVAARTAQQQVAALQLAEQLQISFVNNEQHQQDFLLMLTEQHLELHALCFKNSRPLFVDFLHGTMAHRQQSQISRKQLIARAVGLKPHYNPFVLDVTAGLGLDGVVLANLGCQVTLLERSPIIASLLQDGLTRLLSVKSLALKFFHKNALDYLQNELIELPEVIYLDPMYPHSTNSALNKQTMRIIRALVGDDDDADAVLALALSKATKRVVVKRPRLAPCLNGPKVDLQYHGKACRFDVYWPSVIEKPNVITNQALNEADKNINLIESKDADDLFKKLEI